MSINLKKGDSKKIKNIIKYFTPEVIKTMISQEDYVKTNCIKCYCQQSAQVQDITHCPT